VTSSVRIRVAVPGDAEAITTLRAVVFPFLVRTAEQTRRLITEPRPGAGERYFVAVVDGELAGSVAAARNVTTSQPDAGEIRTLHVAPGRRGQGVGAALLRAAQQHLAGIGVRTARAWALPESVGFAQRFAYLPRATMRYSALDLTGWTANPAAPEGFRLVPVHELDPRAVYEADVEASADEPGDVPVDQVTYEQWRYDVWDDPGMDHRLGAALLAGSEVAAFSLVSRDGRRIWSDYTATRRKYRGRGLARLVKEDVLARAAADGVTTAWTSNDATNAAMLAVNARLGYRTAGEQRSCIGPVG
jgi:GNAT superfamily N-acetyltransferase